MKVATTLSFGCSRLGKAAFEDTTSLAQSVLDKAWTMGIRSFDTASNYTYGDSERLLAKFIEGKEKDIVICTKGGTLLTKNASFIKPFRPLFNVLRPIVKRGTSLKRISAKRKNFDKAYLLDKMQQSTDRMGENIYAYQLHNPTREVLQDRSYIDFFEEIKSKFNVRSCGVALADFEDIQHCAYLSEIDNVQFPLNYYSFRPENEATILKLREMGLELSARTPFQRGLLTDINEIKTGGKVGSKDIHVRERKKVICEKYNISEIQLALWFLKDMALLDSILFSSFNLDHLEENINVFNSEIPSHFSWRSIVRDLES